MLVKFASILVVMGVLAHLLPAVGLQFRKLAHLGSAAPVAGTVMIVLGLFVLLYVTLLKGRMLWVVLGGATLFVTGVAALLLIGWWQSRSWSAPRQPRSFTSPGASPAQQPPHGLIGRGPPGPSGTPGPVGMAGPLGMAGPAGTGRPPSVPAAPTFESLAAQFGPDRVVRIDIIAADGIDIPATVRRCIDALPPEKRPKAWRVTHSGASGQALLAPLASMDDVRLIFTCGSTELISQAERRLKLTLDPARSVMVVPR